MIFGAILAGGSGSRMRTADRPKQFLMLGDRPIVIHTLEKFLACARLQKIYIGIHPDWADYMGELLDRYCPEEKARIGIFSGGSDRNETLMNVIRGIETEYGESEEHILITHDAVRPFVSLELIEANIEAAIRYGAVDTVIPAVDTIVVSNDGDTIDEIPNRASLYQSQTPQSFRMQLLKELYASLREEEKSILTDACKICVVRQYPVHLVAGSPLNLKITTPEDYQLAQRIAERD